MGGEVKEEGESRGSSLGTDVNRSKLGSYIPEAYPQHILQPAYHGRARGTVLGAISGSTTGECCCGKLMSGGLRGSGTSITCHRPIA